ncbi:PQQ-binding-like beta-propeller repeat protein [Enteractinococcus helveticum]|uniref:Pyrrolo-quinoline quinone n=1 Tax=Enteractinococcus helveticum TaxID=1837282 RepID=A0A1B7M1E1_9MICC|nr:PQQ-binding-like beta-propeller repeat protein [Enteractinococcus helveticum]OAV62375.1 hypothetical protein A6F49_06605 [Enteractinococcus helveticum]
MVKSQIRLGLAVLSAVVLTACGAHTTSQDDQLLPDYDPTPTQVNTPAVEADKADLWLPLQLAEQQVLSPGWLTAPLHADGVFLSAEHHHDVLTFRAVDTTGTILWEAQRPLSCTGFTLTAANDQHLAVLTDIDADVQTFGHTTATAYDLRTGQQVWGPVDVPGPHHGPGTVFAAPPEAAMGASGDKVVLDPASGQVLLDERQAPEAKILGEFYGLVLVARDDEVQAFETSALAEAGLEADPSWSLSTADHNWDDQQLHATAPSPNPDMEYGTGAILIGTNSTDRALISLVDGVIIAEEVAAAGQDSSSQTWVTVGQELAGYSPQGELLFVESLEGLQLIGVGGAIAYVENADGDVQTHNVITGALSRSYDPQAPGELVVPQLIDTNGAAILEGDHSYYLVPGYESRQ